MENKVALVTGSAKRIGAVIAKTLHHQGMNIVLHCHHSIEPAKKLKTELNQLRPQSVIVTSGNISAVKDCQAIIETAREAWGRLDALINNASSFFPTPLKEATESHFDDLIGSNLKGPFFLAQAAASWLKETKGNIVNITDIHAERPLKNYPIYCSAKAGLVLLTKSLARELAPDIRVNAVAPGAILWPNEQNDLSDIAKEHILDRVPLKHLGSPQDIADTVWFLLNQGYITGQIIAVDGGRSIKD
jgi:pteridine reductase